MPMHTKIAVSIVYKVNRYTSYGDSCMDGKNC